jgi:hypothetical protein
MLIDDLAEKEVKVCGSMVSDAVVFKVDEDCDLFSTSNPRDFSRMETFLPYENIVINFSNAVYYYSFFKFTGDEKHILIASSFSKGLLGIYDQSHLNPYTIYIFNKEMYLIKWEFYHEYGEDFNHNDKFCSGDCLLILFQFLRILECKNIKKEIFTHNKKIQKKRQSRGKRPLVSFYTLKLIPISKYSKNPPQNLWKTRVHLCRGHMRKYTDQGKLFGKYVGRFWIAPQMRGDKRKGLIIKDYEICRKEKTNERQED